MAVFFVISYIVTKPDTWKEVSKKIFQLFRKRRRKYKMVKSIRFFMQDIGGQMMRSVHIEEFESYADLEDYLKTVECDDEMVKLHSQLMETLNAESIERFTWKDALRDYWLE